MWSNKFGDLVLNASVTSPGGTVPISTGLWTTRSGPLSLLLRNGDPAPGLPGATISINIGTSPALNNQGQVAFPTNLAGAGVVSTNDAALLFEDHGNTKLLVREGDAAPGTPAGAIFSTFVSEICLNNAGQIAFRATLAGLGVTGQNSAGLWAGSPEKLQLVARTGDPAPGISGATFSTLSLQRLFTLNDLGQLAFIAQLAGPGITTANDSSIWATDVSGALHLIAREGDAIDVAAGTSRTISELLLREGAVSESIALNNRGQVAFRARYSDGEGVFISNAVAVPEPTALLLVLAACPLATLRHRRSR
jgi:hypothetical protein